MGLAPPEICMLSLSLRQGGKFMACTHVDKTHTHTHTHAHAHTYTRTCTHMHNMHTDTHLQVSPFEKVSRPQRDKAVAAAATATAVATAVAVATAIGTNAVGGFCSSCCRRPRCSCCCSCCCGGGGGCCGGCEVGRQVQLLSQCGPGGEQGRDGDRAAIHLRVCVCERVCIVRAGGGVGIM